MASAAEQLAANLNFSAFAKAEELKKRIWFTLGALLVYRLATYIPLPGINPEAYAQAFDTGLGARICGSGIKHDGLSFGLAPIRLRFEQGMEEGSLNSCYSLSGNASTGSVSGC